MLTNHSQLIERNLNRVTDNGRLLVVSPLKDDLGKLLPENTSYISSDFPTINYWKNKSTAHQVDSIPEFFTDAPKQSFSSALIFMPKSKDELKFNIAGVLPLLEEGGELFVVGSKKEGIASANKVLMEYGPKSVKIDSARHCVLWMIKPNQSKPFEIGHFLKRFPTTVGSFEASLVSLPGVFAHGKLDVGTQFLLETLEDAKLDISGKWLDFASGCGVVGAYLAKQFSNVSVEGVDCNLLAIRCAQLAFKENNLSANFEAGDGLNGLGSRKYNGIITNPPFHTGVKTDYSVTEQFILDAKKHLKPNGTLIMVANSFLDYDERLKSVFGNVTTLSGNNKFNVYMSTR